MISQTCPIWKLRCIMNRNLKSLARLTLVVAIGVPLVACKEQPPDPARPGVAAGESAGTVASDAAQNIGIDHQLSLAKQDLAARLKIEVSDIEVETVRNVQWRSGAAGCPQPGMSYTMAIVPGVLIVLKANGEIYRYHGGVNLEPFYCPAERAEAPAYGMGEEAM